MIKAAFGQPPEHFNGELRWFVRHQGRLLLTDEARPSLPQLPLRVARMVFAGEPQYLGQLHSGEHCMAVDLADQPEPPTGFVAEELRRLIGLLDETDFLMASRALQLLVWQRNHRFCGRCGAPTERLGHELAMLCPSCGLGQYPRVTPCIITLVHREDRVLLGHNARFPQGLYSCLAGFVEAGEDAEHALAREVWEESGLRVDQLRYHGSQSWPFPHSLMLAYHARHHSGEIRVDGEEIVDAQWFDRQQLPSLPPSGSIARSLIDSWLDGTFSYSGFA